MSITRIHDGSGFVPYTDGMTVDTDMPRLMSTRDGYDTVRLHMGHSDGAVTHIGRGAGINEDGRFQRGRT